METDSKMDAIFFGTAFSINPGFAAGKSNMDSFSKFEQKKCEIFLD
jgi:hypothetical protein